MTVWALLEECADLDPALRGEVASIIEIFCADFPLATLLATSRMVGYGQAELDPGQFTAYRLTERITTSAAATVAAVTDTTEGQARACRIAIASVGSSAASSAVVASRSMHGAHRLSSTPFLRSMAQITTSSQAASVAMRTLRPPLLPDPVIPTNRVCLRRKDMRQGSASSSGPRSAGLLLDFEPDGRVKNSGFVDEERNVLIVRAGRREHARGRRPSFSCIP
jgi:hypothetical protein